MQILKLSLQFHGFKHMLKFVGKTFHPNFD